MVTTPQPPANETGKLQPILRPWRAQHDLGTVTFAGLLETEHAWLQFRDAWLTLLKLAAPKYPTATFAAMLTEQRTAQLNDVLDPPAP